MKKYMTTLEYLTAILGRDETEKVQRPFTVDNLEEYLWRKDKNYWTYPLDEIHFETFNQDDNLVMVMDDYGNARVFEITETETW